MECPRCKSTKNKKNGKSNNNKQRYKCKACKYEFTVSIRGISAKIKRKAVRLFVNGHGVRAIGRLLEVSHVSVIEWVRISGEERKH